MSAGGLVVAVCHGGSVRQGTNKRGGEREQSVGGGSNEE